MQKICLIVNDWVLSAYEALDILLSTKIQNHAKYCEKKKPSKLRKQVNGLDVEAILQKNKVMGGGGNHFSLLLYNVSKSTNYWQKSVILPGIGKC